MSGSGRRRRTTARTSSTSTSTGRHDPELDTPERRDEIARITNGYSPAMIEQICSMALTNAHHEGELQFNWQHLVDAMTAIESGTAIGIRYVEHETRAVAIHEAGHATTAHVYRPDLESSRLSIRMRGGSLGHHQVVPAGGALQQLAQRGDGRPRARRSARWPQSTSSTASLERRRRRPAYRHRACRDDGRRGRHGAAAAST